MFCPKCNYSNPDNVSYCQRCGNLLTAQAQTNYAPSSYGYQQSYQSQAAVASSPLVRSSHPVLNVVKNCGVSPIFIIAIIAFSISALIQIIGLISDFSNVFSDMGNYIPDIIKVGVVSVIVFMFTSVVLLLVGMWMTFASAINRNDGGMKTAGLTIIKVLSIINIVVSSLISLVGEIALIYVMSQLPESRSYYGYSSEVAKVKGVIVFGMFAVAIVAAVLIVFYLEIVRTINTMKKTISTGVASSKVSMVAAVLCTIPFVIIGKIIIYSTLTSIPYFSTIVSAVGGNLNAISFGDIISYLPSLCFGIFLFYYRNKMITLLTPNLNLKPQGTGYSQGAYSQGAYSQGAYSQGSKPQGVNPQGAYSQGAYSQGAYSQGSKPQGVNPQGAYSQGAYSQGAYSQGANPQGANPQGAYSQGANPQNVYSQGVNPQTAKPQNVYSQGVNPQTAKPQNVYSQTVNPQTSKPQEAKPQEDNSNNIRDTYNF